MPPALGVGLGYEERAVIEQIAVAEAAEEAYEMAAYAVSDVQQEELIVGEPEDDDDEDGDDDEDDDSF
ncbi:GL25838 [Drosophila persimilis]|uniref:GL25838 n=1 Tax=Drosophila persimilis TaxID=7234 RepID=B4GJM9_DROPE|nr:GL25838 [Drosophila persimilis]